MANTTELQLSSTREKQSSLATLPPELRLNIYGHLLDDGLHVPHLITRDGVFITPSHRHSYNDVLALAGLCRKIKDELDDFVAYRMSFEVFVAKRNYFGSSWFRPNGSLLHNMRHVHIRFPSACTNNDMESLLETVRKVAAVLMRSSSLQTVELGCCCPNVSKRFVNLVALAYCDAVLKLEERGVRVSLSCKSSIQKRSYQVMSRVFHEAGWEGNGGLHLDETFCKH